MEHCFNKDHLVESSMFALYVKIKIGLSTTKEKPGKVSECLEIDYKGKFKNLTDAINFIDDYRLKNGTH